MNIYTSLQIGAFHTNYCEDFFIYEPISNHYKLVAVLDGCTMGTESAFAAILYGKILRKIAKEYYYKDFISKEIQDANTIRKTIIRKLIQETIIIKNQLDLETNELLATLILGIIDTTNSTATCITIGDGLIYVDGKTYEYDQNDKPDYLGYHLYDDFDYWYEQHDQKLSIAYFKDMSICTDGIFTFKHLKDVRKQKSETEIIEYLLVDIQHAEYENFLDRKIRYIRDQWHHIVTDDLAMIRMINTP